eukprot:TRINITY_DN583_c0_g1_i5.p1 TRINITY_DN583_c0_g1~~TRINITY_DN583_c0_g1_i5.p1  ORF type:complete len:844 (-),score=295.04 TRINITY_DN583_c0_g1_i5:84-2579(-)
MSSKNQWKGEGEFVKELSKFKEVKPPIPASKINKIAKLASLNSQYYKYVVYEVEKFMNKYVSQNEDCNLTSIYIIDAICKYSKSKYGDKDKFCARFEKNLDYNFSMLCKGKSSSDKTFHSLNRTLGFWEKNNMFNLEVINKLRMHLPTHLTYEKLEGDGISTNKNNTNSIENLALNLPDLQGLDPNQPDTLNFLMNILMSGNNKSDHDQLVYQHKKENLLEIPTGNPYGDFNVDPSLLTSNYENLEPNNNPNKNSGNNSNPPINPPLNNNNPPQGGMYNPNNPESGFGGQFDNYNNPNIHNPNQSNPPYNNNQYYDPNQPQDFNNIPNNIPSSLPNNNFPQQDTNNFPLQEKGEHFGTIRIRTKTLWLGNVSNDLSEEIVSNSCKEFGRIALVKYLPQSFIAFVTYVTRLEAENAYASLNGFTMNGKTWKIGWANGDFLDKNNFSWKDGSGPLNKSKLKFPKFQYPGQTVKSLIEFSYEIDESTLDYNDPLQKSLSSNPNINPEPNPNNSMNNNNNKNMNPNMLYNPNLNSNLNMGMNNPNVNFNPNLGFNNNNANSNMGFQNNMMESTNNMFDPNNNNNKFDNNRFSGGGRNNYNNNNRNNQSFDDTDKFLNDLKNNPQGEDNRKFSRGGDNNNNRRSGSENSFRRNDNDNSRRSGSNDSGYDNNNSNRRNDNRRGDDYQHNSRFSGGNDRVSKFSGGGNNDSRFGGGNDRVSKFSGGGNNDSRFGGGNDRVSKFSGGNENDNQPNNNRFDNNNSNNRFNDGNDNFNNNNRFGGNNDNPHNNSRFDNNNRFGGNDGGNSFNNNNNKRDNRNNFNRRDDRRGDNKRNKRDD